MSHHKTWWMARTFWAKHVSLSFCVLVIGAGTITMGCAHRAIDYQAPASAACDKPAPTIAAGSFALSDYQPLPIDVLEQKLRFEPFTILDAKSTSRGTTGAMSLRLQFGDCSVVRVKWKGASKRGDAYNNSPRKQLAAYAIQKLFLAPHEYMVPVTVMRCVPAKQLTDIGAEAVPQLQGTDCVFGILAVWLSNVTVPKKFLDRDRFEASVQRAQVDGYAWQMGNFNLFTYLISHRDARKGNFLVSNLPEKYQAFSIDNDLAFSGLGNPRPDVPLWRVLKVDTFPRLTVDRLRRLTREQLDQKLATLAEFVYESGRGVLPAQSFSDNLDPKKAIRTNGHMPPDRWVGQFGMTQREINHIEKRLGRIFARIDRQEIVLFP